MRLRSVSPTAAFAVVLSIVSALAHAEDKAASAVSAQELKAKTDYCKTCCKSRSNNASVKRPIGLAAPEQNCGS